MWLYLEGPDSCIGTGELRTDSLRWDAVGIKRKHPALRPGEIYKLYIYGSGVEIDEFWTPQVQDGILMLEMEREPDPQQDPPPPSPEYCLLLRIRFRVANDGLLPKVLRWGFESRKDLGASKFLHLPIHANVSRKKLFVVIASLAGAQFFSHFYSKVMQLVSSQNLTLTEFLWSIPVTAIFGLITYFSLSVLFGWMWNAFE